MTAFKLSTFQNLEMRVGFLRALSSCQQTDQAFLSAPADVTSMLLLGDAGRFPGS